MKFFLLLSIVSILSSCNQGSDAKPAPSSGTDLPSLTQESSNYDSSGLRIYGPSYDNNNVEKINFRYAEAILSRDLADGRLMVSILFAENGIQNSPCSGRVRMSQSREAGLKFLTMSKGILQKVRLSNAYGIDHPMGFFYVFGNPNSSAIASQFFGAGDVTITDFNSETITVSIDNFIADSFSLNGQATVKICK